MNAIDFHSAIADQFDSRYDSSVAFIERFRVWTALFARYVKPADWVMDMGCGSGVFSHHLAEKGCTVTAVDGSVAMIDRCNQKKTLAHVCYTVQTLPLDDLTTFRHQDVIIASSLLEYMDDMTQLLQQVNALLKPNGLFIVSLPNRLSLYRRVERVVFALTGWPRYLAHSRNGSTEKMFTRHLNDLGFRVLEIAYFSGSDPVSRVAKWMLPERYVNNLFVGVYRKVLDTSPDLPAHTEFITHRNLT